MNIKADCRPAPDSTGRYNVYMKDCPARLLLDRLADKWTLLILKILKQQPYRFNQLRREIEGISPKVLSQTLQKLERDGLLTRKAFATVPVTVEYSLSALGYSLSELIEPLAVWAQTHIGQVLRAHTRHDRLNA